jgi:hypothetical protein
MRKLLLLYILTIVPLIMPLNTQAMYIVNSPISNINVSNHSSLITINDTPWTHFINSDFFVYLLNNKIKILIVSAAGIFLINKIFFSTPKSPNKTKRNKQTSSFTKKSRTKMQTNTSHENNSISLNCLDMSNNTGMIWNVGDIRIGCSNNIIADNGSKVTINNDSSSYSGRVIESFTSNSSTVDHNPIYNAGERNEHFRKLLLLQKANDHLLQLTM